VFKRSILNLLTLPRVAPALSALTRTQVTIFMLHRFAVPYLGISGRDPESSASQSRHSIRPVMNSVSKKLLQRLRNGDVDASVAFTIDDGYFDQAEIAAPIFVEFDCPVTCFVATGFLDRQVWFWWDRLMTIFEKQTARVDGTNRPGWRSSIDGTPPHRAGRRGGISISDARMQLKASGSPASTTQLRRGGRSCRRASARFAPMSWKRRGALESARRPLRPHTVTHPVLCAASAAQAEWEITESWKRLNAEVTRPVPLFCYPNGRSRTLANARFRRFAGLVCGED
jgi:hypothetical protein